MAPGNDVNEPTVTRDWNRKANLSLAEFLLTQLLMMGNMTRRQLATATGLPERHATMKATIGFLQRGHRIVRLDRHHARRAVYAILPNAAQELAVAWGEPESYLPTLRIQWSATLAHDLLGVDVYLHWLTHAEPPYYGLVSWYGGHHAALLYKPDDAPIETGRGRPRTVHSLLRPDALALYVLNYPAQDGVGPFRGELDLRMEIDRATEPLETIRDKVRRYKQVVAVRDAGHRIVVLFITTAPGRVPNLVAAIRNGLQRGRPVENLSFWVTDTATFFGAHPLDPIWQGVYNDAPVSLVQLPTNPLGNWPAEMFLRTWTGATACD